MIKTKKMYPCRFFFVKMTQFVFSKSKIAQYFCDLVEICNVKTIEFVFTIL